MHLSGSATTAAVVVSLLFSPGVATPAPIWHQREWTIVEVPQNSSTCEKAISRPGVNGALSFLDIAQQLYEPGCFKDLLMSGFYPDFDRRCVDEHTILTTAYSPPSASDAVCTGATFNYLYPTVVNTDCMAASLFGHRPDFPSPPADYYRYKCSRTAELVSAFNFTGVVEVSSIGHTGLDCDDALANSDRYPGETIPLDGTCVQRPGASSRASCNPVTGEVLWVDYSGEHCEGYPQRTSIATLRPRCFVMPSFSGTFHYLGTVTRFQCGPANSEGPQEGGGDEGSGSSGDDGEGGGGDSSGGDDTDPTDGPPPYTPFAAAGQSAPVTSACVPVLALAALSLVHWREA